MLLITVIQQLLTFQLVYEALSHILCKTCRSQIQAFEVKASEYRSWYKWYSNMGL